MREVFFHKKALEALRAFPKETRRGIGKAIRDLQRGYSLEMPLAKPMPSVGPGVAELRIRDRDGIYRTFYYVKSKRGVFVFHAFMKKTQKTPQQELEFARRRLKELLNETEK